MLRKIIRRIKESQLLRQIIILLSVIGLYFFLIGLASELVDQKTIEKDLKNWFEKSLNYSTYVNIDHTDTALRSDWRTDLYIHELEIASPNPTFVLPVLSVDTIRASSSFYSLFGGVKSQPVIQIRDGILNIQRDKAGNYNISGLESSIQEKAPDFLPFIDISSIDFALMNCKVLLTLLDSTASININGNLLAKDNLLTLKGFCKNAKFTKTVDEVTKTYETDINIHQFTINRKNRQIIKSNITVENMPTTVLKMLYPELPELPTGLSFSGIIKTKEESLLFLGQLENINIPQLPRYLDIKATINRNILNTTEFFSIEVSTIGQNILTLKSNKSKNNEWDTFKIFISSFNVNKLFSSSESYWLNYLVSKFSAINLLSSSATISNFNIGEAIIRIVKSDEGEANISLEGIIADGKLTLFAKNISLTNTDLPETVMATLEIKDTASTLVKFSKMLPEILDCTPTSGKGELAILYKWDKNNSESSQTKVQLKLEDVTIPTLSSGAAITNISSIPKKLNKLNKLCFDPLRALQMNGAELINPLSKISLTSLIVSYETNNNHIILSDIEAKCKEIGNIKGKLSNLENGKLKLVLDFYNLPAETIKLAKLSKTSKNAFFKYIKSKPLRIELIEGKEISNRENMFVENIYKKWLNNQKLSKTKTGEKE